MTERLADVALRIKSVGQLGAVIGAMRALAAARARDARGKLEAARAYEGAIAEAIGRALAIADGEFFRAPARGQGATAVIAFGAEQGFAGAFNARILDAARAAVAEPRAQLFLLGARALISARAGGLDVSWSHPMIAHLDRAPALAEAIVAKLFEGLASHEIDRVTAIYGSPSGFGEVEIVTRTLAPFDYRRFPKAKVRIEPLITLPPRALLARLADEYIFAEIAEAAVLSFAAENEARLKAMTGARAHIDELLERLQGRARALRQEEITNEIVELAADADAMAEA